ncbi:MAG: FKBP-type peptidyl-prolyl cis-trans isomerase [Bacteroidales bacterium]
MKRSDSGYGMSWRLHPVLIVLAVGTMLWGCKSLRSVPEPVAIVTASGLEYLITKAPGNDMPEQGDIVKIHYVGKLEDGTVFDSSYERKEPVTFRLGNEQVIAGLEEGVSYMSEGGQATLVIPPELAYGDRSFGPVPANATLVFEVELVDITSPAATIEDADVVRNTLDNGLEYAVVEQGRGKKLEEGMMVTIHYTGYLEDETIFDSSYDRGKPIKFTLGKGMVIPGWEQGLMQLNEGDKARLYIPHELAYGEAGRGPIPPMADLVFDVEVIDATVIEPPRPFDVAGLDTLETEEGLQYIIVQEGSGQQPNPGQVVHVHYTGYLADGTLFDSSIQRGEPFRFVLGQGQVIQGWDHGFALLSKGARARFIVPPHLAYGQRDMGVIPPGTTLVFDVELIDF